jgi:2-dehydro-3-deoxyphosphogluconate aldolase/(4S)-4-hydroxy-2-oxoglutarate aldolase
MNPIESTLDGIKIIPVITPESAQNTVELAKALIAGGIHAIEITLRTEAAIDSVIAVKESGLDITLGVGTITSSALVHTVSEIGIDFGVSPGSTPSVLAAAKETNLPLLPGVTSPSEIMLGLEYGLQVFKLFPAEAVNGVNLLKSLHGPFPDVRFCPTGGISLSNSLDYINLPNVICIGGSWMVPTDLVKSGQWQQITQLCKDAMTHIS